MAAPSLLHLALLLLVGVTAPLATAFQSAAVCAGGRLAAGGAHAWAAQRLPLPRAARRPAPRATWACAEREFPAVPVPPSQIDRAIVAGQRRELHLYDPANVAAVRRANDGDGQFLHVVMEPEALARKEFALCTYGTVLRIVNCKPSVHRTMMGQNVEALLVDVVGTRRTKLGNLVQEEPYVAVKAAEPNKTPAAEEAAGRSVLDNVVDKAEMLFEQCRSIASQIPTLEAQQIPLPMGMPRSPFTYGIGPGEPEPEMDRALSDMVNEAVALREGDGELMTKDALLELRASAAVQLLSPEDRMKLFTTAAEPAQVRDPEGPLADHAPRHGDVTRGVKKSLRSWVARPVPPNQVVLRPNPVTSRVHSNPVTLRCTRERE
jgi:Lon protease-like protein